LRKVFSASHLSVIQFHLKIVTKCLNFSHVKCVFWHNSKYTWLIQCSNSNKNNMVDSFTYMQVSWDDNFMIWVSCIFTSSITRSWIASDEGTETAGIAQCQHVAVMSSTLMRQYYPIAFIITKEHFTENTGPTLIPMSRYL